MTIATRAVPTLSIASIQGACLTTRLCSWTLRASSSLDGPSTCLHFPLDTSFFQRDSLLAHRTSPSPIAAALSQSAIYREAIARTAEALALHRPDDSEALVRDGAALAQRLAVLVSSGAYQHGAAPRHLILLDKLRSVVQLSTIDRVVHCAMALVLSRAFEAHYSDDLYSYRAGRGRMPIVDRLLAIAATNRAQFSQPQQRGLWVIRFDVSSYGDSIRIDEHSELWRLLARWIPDEPPWVTSLIKLLTRCAAFDEFAERGVPTGSPLCNALVNLYLSDLDEQLGKRCPLYLRFGDDVTFVCHDADAAEEAFAVVAESLARKQLRLNPGKVARLYWNGAGRQPARDGWHGAQYVTFVGFDVGFLGSHRVKTSAQRELVAAIVERLRCAERELPREWSPAERARALSRCGRALLDPHSPFVLPTLAELLVASNCRRQFAVIDRQIATTIAELAVSKRGPKAFRTVSWRSLHDAGLPSLTAIRNRGQHNTP